MLVCNKTMNEDVFPQIPSETAKVARAIFSKGNFYMIVGDQANQLFSAFQWEPEPGSAFKDLQSLASLYLITVFQVKEAISDFAAFEAVQNRVDWKYALHLPINNPGWKIDSLCNFRQWLVAKPSRQQNLQNLISRLRREMVNRGTAPFGSQSELVVARICWISRMEVIHTATNRVLDLLSSQQPELLSEISLPQWFAYQQEAHRQALSQASDAQQADFAQALGAEVKLLLELILKWATSALADQPQVKTLSDVWRAQFYLVDEKVFWRMKSCAHCTSITRNHSNMDYPTNTSRRAYEN